MRIAAALATLAAACALALAVAYWGWQILGPAPVRLTSPAPADGAATIVGAHLFGRGDARPQDAGAPAATLPADTRLVGIVAAGNGQGYAVFRAKSGALVVPEGDEIASGVRLVAIAPDAITLRDGSGERRFALRPDARATALPTAVPGNGPATARVAAASASCAPPPGFRGSVVRLNTELLGGLDGDAGPWRTLLAAADGGLVVRDDNGFGAMLGLRAGDRIAQANGIALRIPDDVASAVIRPLVANQGVRLVGSRDGTRQELWLANVACAG